MKHLQAHNDWPLHLLPPAGDLPPARPPIPRTPCTPCQAMRDWAATSHTSHYMIGSAVGPHPFPTMVRDFQSVISRECREQFLEEIGKLPDKVCAWARRGGAGFA